MRTLPAQHKWCFLLALLMATGASAAWIGRASEQTLPNPLVGESSYSSHPGVASREGHRPARSAEVAACEHPELLEGIPTYPSFATVGHLEGEQSTAEIQLCQCCGPRAISGVDCGMSPPCGEATWKQWGLIPWEVMAQGEYIGPARTQQVPVYRIRVDDRLEFVYRLTRQKSQGPYELCVGDTVRIQSLFDEILNREVVIQPDGTITLMLLGQVPASGLTVQELNDSVNEAYTAFYQVPAITVTPLSVDTKLEDLRAAVDSRFGVGGQTRDARVTPEGTIQLPAIGSVPAQGLTLDELKREVDARYAEVVQGMEVQPVLRDRAPRYVYVVGEVQQSGRFVLEAPTTVMQAIALAGGWNNGGNLREIVVFRRADDWRLMATKLDLRGALLGERPCPADEIWVRDSDIIVVPKSEILRAVDFIDLVFTRGIYGVMPFQGMTINYAKLSTI